MKSFNALPRLKLRAAGSTPFPGARQPHGRRALLPFLVLWVLGGIPQSLAAKVQSIWTGIDKVVAVGDLHGDYDNFVRILKGTDLIEGEVGKERWIGGKTHLIQMGDIMDRGDDAKKIFDLVMRLEKEAGSAGGYVHLLIGNHEEINIMERSFEFPDYITVSQFRDFISDDYRSDMEKRYRRGHGGKGPGDSYWEDLMKTEEARAEYYRNFNEVYGRWISEHNVVIKIDDTVFVHGGLTPDYAARGIDTINALYHSEFQRWFRGDVFRPKILFAPDGPLWFRDLAQVSEDLYMDQLDKTLAALGAGHMVIAHTPVVIERNMSRFDEKIWIIDTGISRVYRAAGGHPVALIINKGKFSRRNFGG